MSNGNKHLNIYLSINYVSDSDSGFSAGLMAWDVTNVLSETRRSTWMLRITTDDRDGAVVLRLEGVIRALWVPVFESACRDAANKASHVQLDLAQVRFVDEVGVEALKRLVASGVTIGGCTNFVRELLQAEDVR